MKMSANVETMFYHGEVPWHKLGTPVEKALDSLKAIKMAGLDWTVEKKPLFTNMGNDENYIPMDSGFMATVRMSDNTPLGVVTDKYQPVQNVDAFSFTDNLVGNDCRYETAGSLKNGQQVWLLAKLPESKILGDVMENYLVFTNSHDGKGSIRIAMTPVRVVCQNTLNIALREAKRSWSTKHMGNMESKMEEAKMTLQLANVYSEELAKKAEELAAKKMYELDFERFLKELYPISDDASSIITIRANELRQRIRVCYDKPDLADFQNTAWGILNAVSDAHFHGKPMRETQKYQENLFANTIGGNMFLDKAYELLTA
jgi:phage/plasmid-like protein (TIGR03299 family)